MEFIAIQDMQQQTLARNRREWEAFAARLEEIGGTKLVLPLWWDEHVPHLTRHGVAFDCDQIVFSHGGETSGCHRNVSRLYLDQEIAAIATGYGLTLDDGMWRQHTWGVSDDGLVVETTVHRDAYFGFRLPEEMAARWARAQLEYA